MTAVSTEDLDPRIVRSRTKILDAATELLIEGGMRALTVDAVAEHSGVAKSTLYRHWSSVNELLVDVFRCNVPGPPDIDPTLPFEDGLRSWMHQAVATLSAPDWLRILPALLELRASSPDIAGLLDADLDEKMSSMQSLLDRGAREGRIPAGTDARLVANTLAGPLFLTALTGHGPELDLLADFVVERFLRSFP